MVHQLPDERLQVVILGAILRRDDEAELVTVAAAALEERLAVDAVLGSAIERAPLALARRAVALQVAQVRNGARRAFAGELDDAGLYDDATATADTPKDAAAWCRAQDIRAFVAARATQMAIRAGQPDRTSADDRKDDFEARRWLQWASDQADRIDPLRTSPPSIIDTPEHDVSPVSIWSFDR